MKCKQSILKNTARPVVDFPAFPFALDPKVTRSYQALCHCTFLKPHGLSSSYSLSLGRGGS